MSGACGGVRNILEARGRRQSVHETNVVHITHRIPMPRNFLEFTCSFFLLFRVVVPQTHLEIVVAFPCQRICI